eukprot:2509842-Pyramimonas_sp.AAC.1
MCPTLVGVAISVVGVQAGREERHCRHHYAPWGRAEGLDMVTDQLPCPRDVQNSTPHLSEDQCRSWAQCHMSGPTGHAHECQQPHQGHHRDLQAGRDAVRQLHHRWTRSRR